jgi:hypothetical protein
VPVLGAEAGEGVEIAPPHAVPPPAAGTGHLGARCPSAPDFPAMRMPALQRSPSIESRMGFLRRGANWTCNLGNQFVISSANFKKKKKGEDKEIEQNARRNLTPGKPGIR